MKWKKGKYDKWKNNDEDKERKNICGIDAKINKMKYELKGKKEFVHNSKNEN